MDLCHDPMRFVSASLEVAGSSSARETSCIPAVHQLPDEDGWLDVSWPALRFSLCDSKEVCPAPIGSD